LSTSDLIDNDNTLNARYYSRPKVLSNALHRYSKQGLLHGIKSTRRGHPVYYKLTEKGYNRLLWFINNQPELFPDNLRKQVEKQKISIIEKRNIASKEKGRQSKREIEHLIKNYTDSN